MVWSGVVQSDKRYEQFILSKNLRVWLGNELSDI
jgi:hypothetical protein